jgi:UDP-sulfoquinovose synthase
MTPLRLTVVQTLPARSGGQTRGYLETFSVNQVAEAVKRVGDGAGLNVAIKSIPNPRKELEEHYYNPAHSDLKELGLKPHYMTDDVIAAMLERIMENKDRIVTDRIMPRVRWN